MKIIYFHRNKDVGYSIDKVTQTVIGQFEDKEEYYVPGKTASISDILKNILYVYKHRDRKRINHVTGDIHYCMLGLIGCKSVLTIHDTVMVDYNSYSAIKRLFLELLWLRIPLALATRVICISSATKNSISRFTKRKDVVVIHNAISNSNSQPLLKVPSDLPNVLIIGITPNKNLERTLKALSGLNCRVTIIGDLPQNIADLIKKLNIDCRTKSHLTDEELNKEYLDCDVVSFVSLFEGFGMPVIEANKMGRPVVCSNIEVLKEVAGDAALFVDPYSVESIKHGFSRLFSEPNLYSELVQKGLENVKRFDPQRQSELLMNVYKSIE